MKCISIAIATLCVVLASTASAQTSCEEIRGGGTPNSIPMFTGTCKVGNSTINQSLDGSIGINTGYIVGRLSVVESRENGINFPQPYAVYGNILSDMNFAAGVRGDASATTGFASGVIGVAYGGGDGVTGLRTDTGTGTGGAGIHGTTNTTSGFSYGARGTANGASGFSVGVFGEAFSPDGYAALLSSHAGGNIIVGTQGSYSNLTNVFRVDGHGTVFADGGFQPNGADFAESMAVTGDRSRYAAGDLLVIDPTASSRLALAQQPYSTLVAGIYSTKPGMLGTTRKVDETAPQNEVPLAVVGIVPCKVTAENGPIRVGDLLVTSSTAGHAMKGTDRSRMLGAVVGKALESLPEGQGIIQVLVTLQ